MKYWNMLCGILHRLNTTQGFQVQSIPQMFTSCNITFQILGYLPIFLLQNQTSIYKYMCPNEIPCMVNPPIRPTNRNINDHFLTEIIQNDGVNIVTNRQSTGLLHLPAISANPSTMLSHPRHAKWWVMLALKLQSNYHWVDNTTLIFLYMRRSIRFHNASLESLPSRISRFTIITHLSIQYQHTSLPPL